MDFDKNDVIGTLFLLGMIICILILSLMGIAHADEKLSDKYGQVFGSIQTLTDGRQIIKNQYGQVFGSFNPKAGPHGQTYNKYGQVVGTGNQLIILLPREPK